VGSSRAPNKRKGGNERKRIGAKKNMWKGGRIARSKKKTETVCKGKAGIGILTEKRVPPIKQ